MPLLTGEDFHNPDLTGPRATHHIPNGGLFSAYASTTIKASPQVVYDALLDVGDWKEWNTFVSNVKITKNPNPHSRKDGSHKRMTGGTCMVFELNLWPDEPERKAEFREVVTHVEKLKLAKGGHSSPCITRIRWSLDNAAITTPGMLFKAERVNEIEEAHDGTTIYRNWQVFGGLGAKFVRKKYEAPLKTRLQDWCRDLKKWCEENGGRHQSASAATNGHDGAGKSEGGQDPQTEQKEA